MLTWLVLTAFAAAPAPGVASLVDATTLDGRFKIDIKYAVETLFKVKVTGVNTAHVRGKLRRQRTAQAGRAPNWKKATVKLQEGQTIDVG